VVQAAEDGQGDECALSGWRGPEFRVRGGDRVNRLRGPHAVVRSEDYRWSKEFLEAGKKRLLGDTTREAA
jgi:hypothetical protein